jgi:hypothetical protein
MFLGLVAGVAQMMPPLVVFLGFHGLCLLLILSLAYVIRRVLRPRIFAAVPGECWAGGAVVAEKPPPVLYVGDEVAASRLATSWGERGP